MRPPSSKLTSPLKRLWQNENFKVFVGVSVVLGVCAIPVFGPFGRVNRQKGHDLFSQEKPEVIDSFHDQRFSEMAKKREMESDTVNDSTNEKN